MQRYQQRAVPRDRDNKRPTRSIAAGAVAGENTDLMRMFERPRLARPVGGRDRLECGNVVSALEFSCSPARRCSGRVGNTQILGDHAAVVLCTLANSAILMAIPFYAPGQIGRLARCQSRSVVGDQILDFLGGLPGCNRVGFTGARAAYGIEMRHTSLFERVAHESERGDINEAVVLAI